MLDMIHQWIILSRYGLLMDHSAMPKPLSRPSSRITRNTITLLGLRIKLARKEHKMTAAELAERARISRGLLQRIEKGDPACQIGAVFEVAAIVGVPILGATDAVVAAGIAETRRLMTLLPKHVHASSKKVKDDF